MGTINGGCRHVFRHLKAHLYAGLPSIPNRFGQDESFTSKSRPAEFLMPESGHAEIRILVPTQRTYRFLGLGIAKGRYRSNKKDPPDTAVGASGTTLKLENKIYSTYF
jgi:hypothetical protein